MENVINSFWTNPQNIYIMKLGKTLVFYAVKDTKPSNYFADNT